MISTARRATAGLARPAPVPVALRTWAEPTVHPQATVTTTRELMIATAHPTGDPLQAIPRTATRWVRSTPPPDETLTEEEEVEIATEEVGTVIRLTFEEEEEGGAVAMVVAVLTAHPPEEEEEEEEAITTAGDLPLQPEALLEEVGGTV